MKMGVSNKDYNVLLTLQEFLDNNWQPIRTVGPIYWRVTIGKGSQAEVQGRLNRETPVAFSIAEEDTVSIFIHCADMSSVEFLGGFLASMPELGTLVPQAFVSLVS